MGTTPALESRSEYSPLLTPTAWLERPLSDQSATRTVPKARILVVDDERMIRIVLSEKLKDAGFDCPSCASGQEALAMLDRERFDVIVADLKMPEMDGMRLLEQVRKKHSGVAFLMATGVNDVRTSVQAMKQGAVDYIVKPFQFDSVIISVERALERKRLEMEVERYRLHLEDLVQERTNQLQSMLRLVEATYEETLETLGWALDMRDASTAGHSRRVSLYSVEMASALGCSADELTQIARGAYLHDIGKLCIPDGILLKKSRLTEEETRVMQTHAEIGHSMVRGIAFLAVVAQIILTHHERFDGLGYPQRLKGEQIPLGARIFALADTFDAITSDRPYRPAASFSAAREEIEREIGRQFDPEVAKIFLSVPNKCWEDIRQAVTERGGAGSSAAAGQILSWVHKEYEAPKAGGEEDKR